MPSAIAVLVFTGRRGRNISAEERLTAAMPEPFSSTELISAFSFPAAYERSCEAYKHAGSTSGHFYIDVDGSGPIRPQLVYCNMTGEEEHPGQRPGFRSRLSPGCASADPEEHTWMTIQHNNSELTRLSPAPGRNQLSVHFDFFMEEEQLAAAISQSEHCEQELSYHCRKSRLLNTPGKRFDVCRRQIPQKIGANASLVKHVFVSL